MLVYAENSAIKAFRKQFPEEAFGTLKARDSFKDYVKFYKDVLPFRPETYQQFLNGLVTTQDSLWRDIAKVGSVEVRAVEVDSVDEAVFFWMIPSEEMVFSFSNAYFEQEGYSFKTRNEQFMKTFYKQFNSKWGTATKIVGGHIYSKSKLF